jgi:hypothetical protein
VEEATADERSHGVGMIGEALDLPTNVDLEYCR